MAVLSRIGLMHAWLFMLYVVLALPLSALPRFKHRFVSTEALLAHGVPVSAVFLETTFRFLLLTYSLFVPIRTATTLFCPGLTIYVIGLTLYIFGLITIGLTDPAMPVTGGLFRYSRHPLHIVPLLTLIGIALMTDSVTFLLFGILFTVFHVRIGIYEEWVYASMYGDAYRQYQLVTPMLFGRPGWRR